MGKRKDKTVPNEAVDAAAHEATPKRLRALTRDHESPDWYNAKPAWSFSVVDHQYVGEWGWDHLASRMGTIFDFLKEMERLSWKEIKAQSYRPKNSAPSAKHHSIPQDQLCKEARDRLSELELDDIDEVFRFRTGFSERLWGVHVPSSGVFCLLWWDPDHRVYPLEN